MAKVLEKKDRVLESINATREDLENLYVVTILDKVTIHFEKKVFGKEEEFRKEAVELRQKHLKAVKCPKGWDNPERYPKCIHCGKTLLRYERNGIPRFRVARFYTK